MTSNFKAGEVIRDEVIVVLIGNFNPMIFQPYWFSSNDMISQLEAERANVEIICPEITKFEAAKLFFTIQSNRFELKCEAIHKDRVLDLASICFGQNLVHTPIDMMGINRDIVFSCGSEAERSELGRSLAPPTAWGDWGEEIGEGMSNDQQHGGMMRVVMQQTPRPDGYEGYIQADVRPIPADRDHSQVFIEVNNHFNVSNDGVLSTAEKAMEILTDRWEYSWDISEKILANLTQRASKQ